MNPSRTITAAAALALAVGLSACGSDSDSADPTTAATTPATADASDAADSAAPSSNTVTIQGSRFAPTDITVAVGDTVTFVNEDPFAHTVTSRDDSALEFDSGSFGQGEPFAVEFSEAGTFAYFCQIHPTMRATVTVG